jgi:hypothetical protein
MKKIILFSLLLIYFVCSSPAYAFYENFDGSVEDSLTRWNALSSAGSSRSSSVSIYSNMVLSPTYTNYGNYIRIRSPDSSTSYLVSKNPINIQYISFMMCGGAGSRSLYLRNSPEGAQSSTVVAQLSGIDTSKIPSKIEIISTDNYIYMYQNGVEVTNIVNPTGSATSLLYPCVAGFNNAFISIDDFSDGSFLDTTDIIYESADTINVKWSAHLLRSHTNSEYNITLYSLTNQINTGELEQWNLNERYFSDGLEFGQFSIQRAETLGLNYGLYMLEMTSDGVPLTNTYFFYDNLVDPQGYPEILLLGESNVHTEIKDEDNNGGEILGGGSVYLYPEINENGIYSFTYDILETPSSIQLDLTKIYNNTALNQTDITISGLLGQNYDVKLNGVSQGKNEGADIFQLSITDWTSPTKTITLEPDFNIPGFWGYVKNEETQASIKSATVTITNGSFTEYLYTDSAGMYYLTSGISPGVYNISAAKSGFTTSNTFQVTAAEGATTRKDIFLAPSSGSGVYYAPHDVRFTIKEFWYSNTLPGVSYSVYDSVTEETDKTGYTDSQGSFTVSNMDSYKNYTIILNYQGTNYTKYIEPGLDEYTLILKEGSTIHSYGASWLNLTYSETAGDIMVYYNSSENIAEASLTVTAINGSTIFTGTNTANTGSFNVDLSAAGEYLILFEIETITGKTASQPWAYSSSQNVDLFPESYPAWLKNTLFGGIVVLFLLSFGKSKNDIACLSVAILTSLGYHFSWHTGSFGFVVLVWIIAAGAAALHYKRTGHLG